MSKMLLDLPVDVLLLIFSKVSVVGIINLQRTCRFIGILCSSDYVWHQIAQRDAHTLPLDMDPGTDIASYNGREVQATLVRAMRLDRNWRWNNSQIRQVICLSQAFMSSALCVDDMRLLERGRWLVTAQRGRSLGRSSSIFSVWALGDLSNPRHAAIFEVFGEYRHFSAVINEEGMKATLAATLTMDNTDSLHMYDIMLSAEAEGSARLQSEVIERKHECNKPAACVGLLDEVIITNHYVVASVVDIGQLEQQLVVMCRKSGDYWVHHLDQILENANIKTLTERPRLISSRHDEFFLVTRANTKLSISTLHNDDCMLSYTTHYDVPISEGDDVHYQFSPSWRPGLACITVLGFSRQGMVSCLRLAFIPPLSANGASQSLPIMMPRTVVLKAASSAIRVAAGAHRSVWIEQNWENDQFRIMKLFWTSARGKDGELVHTPRVAELIGSYPDLPVRPRECHQLAFDEVSGRLCLAVHTGQVYVLDYAM